MTLHRKQTGVRAHEVSAGADLAEPVADQWEDGRVHRKALELGAVRGAGQYLIAVPQHCCK